MLVCANLCLVHFLLDCSKTFWFSYICLFNCSILTEPPSVEDDVDVWRHAIVSCMPETTTMILTVLHRVLEKVPQWCFAITSEVAEIFP